MTEPSPGPGAPSGEPGHAARVLAATAASLEEVAARLGAVERALDAVRDGSYGSCERCGQPVEEDRLAADPAELVCGACAGPAPGPAGGAEAR